MGHSLVAEMYRRIERESARKEVLNVPCVRVSQRPESVAEEVPLNVIQVGEVAVRCSFIPSASDDVRFRRCKYRRSCKGECVLLKH